MSPAELSFSLAVERINKNRRLMRVIKNFFYRTKASVFGLKYKATIKKYYKNGKLIKIINYDKIKGVATEVIYNENGTLGVEKIYKNGKPDGIHKVYYWNGNLRAEMSYRDGKLDGPFKMYQENGNLKFIDYFKDGKKIKRIYKVYR
ncbi:MAG TPA: hypothetical protein VMW81_06020 [Nitrospinota bacterium]|nr:hypothetical protein [Nitrospinota bacterium]